MFGRIVKKIKNFLRGEVRNQLTEIDCLKEKGLVVGEHTIIHSPFCFDNIYPWLIEVGDYCLFSTEVKIIAHDSSTNRIHGVTKIGRVTIGDHVYLGQNVTVLCNVRIGDNVIVGAKSLVNHDLPSNGVYAGNPARFICSMEEFELKHNGNLEKYPVFENTWRYWKECATPTEQMEMKERLRDTFGYIIG